MEPNISDAAVAALWAPTGGIVCPFGLTFALAENAAKNGVQFRFDTKVTGLHRWTAAEPGGPSRPTTARWKHAASSMRRAYTPTRCTIWPTRRTPDHHGPAGEITSCLTTRRGGQCAGTAFVPAAGQIRQGRAGNAHGARQFVGSGRRPSDVDDKEATATTAAGLDEVREKSGLAVRTFRCARPSRASRVCAPTRARHDFFIGEIAPGFVDCAAIESPGLSSAPAIGVMVADIVRGSLHPQ